MRVPTPTVAVGSKNPDRQTAGATRMHRADRPSPCRKHVRLEIDAQYTAEAIAAKPLSAPPSREMLVVGLQEHSRRGQQRHDAERDGSQYGQQHRKAVSLHSAHVKHISEIVAGAERVVQQQAEVGRLG